MGSEETERFIEKLKTSRLDPEVVVVERRRPDTWRTPVPDASQNGSDHRKQPPDHEKQKSWRHDTVGLQKLTEADRARRRQAVARLWVNMDLTVEEIADELGVAPNIVTQDARHMGFPRRPSGRTGLGARGDRIRARRREVLRLHHEEGLGTKAIAERIGSSVTAVQEDKRALGLSRPNMPGPTIRKPRAETTANAIVHMEQMANLILDQNLLGIELTPEQEEEWNRSLSRVTKAVGYVRRSIKKGKL